MLGMGGVSLREINEIVALKGDWRHYTTSMRKSFRKTILKVLYSDWTTLKISGLTRGVRQINVLMATCSFPLRNGRFVSDYKHFYKRLLFDDSKER